MSRRERVLTSKSYPWSTIDPERRNAILLIGGVSAVVVFALALIFYGYYTDRIAPNHATVLTFGNRDFDYKALERRTLADFRDNKLDTKELDKAVAITLSNMEHEEALRVAARREGIAVTDDEVAARIAVKVASAGATRQQVAPALRAKLAQTGLTLADYQDIARSEVAEEKLRTKVEAAIPFEGEQVFLRWIETQAQAQIVQARDALKNGDSFAVAVGNYSTDQASKDKAGEVGWVPRGALPPEVEQVAFSQTGLSDIIETKNAFFIIEVAGKETQPIDGTGRDRISANQMALKVQEARDAAGSDPKLTQGQVNRILRRIVAEAGV